MKSNEVLQGRYKIIFNVDMYTVRGERGIEPMKFGCVTAMRAHKEEVVYPSFLAKINT